MQSQASERRAVPALHCFPKVEHFQQFSERCAARNPFGRVLAQQCREAAQAAASSQAARVMLMYWFAISANVPTKMNIIMHL
jgi:hypothetical protein